MTQATLQSVPRTKLGVFVYFRLQVAQPPQPGREEGRLEARGRPDNLPVPPQPRQPVGGDRQAIARKVKNFSILLNILVCFLLFCFVFIVFAQYRDCDFDLV